MSGKGEIMRIDEIPSDVMVQISVGIGGQILEFSTKVAQVYDKCIYAEPILQNEKMIGFGAAGLVLSMIVPMPEDGKAYQFNEIKIRNIKTAEGALYHEITCKQEGTAINRRGACRVWLGETGTARIGLSRNTIDIIVKDISISGIAFVCDKDVDVPDGAIVNITFRDSVSRNRFELSAIVVRNEEMEKSRIIYGCKLNQESNVVAKFVNDKQREKLRASRQVQNRPLQAM